MTPPFAVAEIRLSGASSGEAPVETINGLLWNVKAVQRSEVVGLGSSSLLRKGNMLAMLLPGNNGCIRAVYIPPQT